MMDILAQEYAHQEQLQVLVDQEKNCQAMLHYQHEVQAKHEQQVFLMHHCECECEVEAEQE